MGAIQAQDYLSSLWAIGLRVSGCIRAYIEQAIADRHIIRTWALRGTLHFVAPHDVRWMLKHLAPRVLSVAARRHRELELDDAVFTRSAKIFKRALDGGKALTRPEMMELLERARITTACQRGYHILWKLALNGLLCCGPRKGKQPTFVLLDEWLPPGRSQSREAAIGDFALRYFTSHGPATIDDFAWWIGMKKSDATAVVASIASQLSTFATFKKRYWFKSSASLTRNGAHDLHLLPSFDEILLGYSDRTDALCPAHAQYIVPGTNGMFMPVIVQAGRVVGTWNRTLTKNSASLISKPFATFSQRELKLFSAAAKRHVEFLGVKSVRD